jgi:hypothetical protein
MKILATALALAAVVGVGAQQPPPTQQQQQQQQPPAPQQDQKQPELTLTGCLVQGSGPSVFVFEKVKKDPKDANERAVKYLVVSAAEDLNLRNHLNHEVRITAIWDGRPAPATAQKVEEKDLPRLSAKSVTMVADTCSATTR